MLIVATLCYSQSDYEIASSFMEKKGITLLCNSSLRNRASSNKNYSIFHGEGNKGFAIVANGNVVGYSTEGVMDEEDMPTALKQALEAYSNSTSNEESREVEAVEPLITTKWRQARPYNTLLTKKIGICSLVAWAQIIHYFRIPQTYCDVVDNEYFNISLPSTSFNHDKMLDAYISGYSQEEADEVSKFFYYLYYALSAYVDPEPIFNITIETKIITREGGYGDLDGALDKKIPIWVADNIHAYVIDGRDTSGYYHVNFGWGGTGDGYYLLWEYSDKCEKEYNKFTYDACIYACLIPNGWTYPTTASNNIISGKHLNDKCIYSLNGVKLGYTLDNLPKGIYIVDGKKIIK